MHLSRNPDFTIDFLLQKNLTYRSLYGMYFYYIAIISPWKRMWPFISKILNSIHPSLLWAKYM